MQKKIKNFLKSLDQISYKISEEDIYSKIKDFIKEEFEGNPPEELIMEKIAFVFPEDFNYISKGIKYHIPKDKSFDKELGKIGYPNRDLITSKCINYWKIRAKEAKHPILKAQYSKLVWGYSHTVTGEKPHYSFAWIYIDSVIEITEKDLHRYHIDVINKLGRALSMALRINDKERIQRLKSVILDYEDKIAMAGNLDY